MGTRDFSWGKGGRCVRLTTYHPCSTECQVFRGLNLPGPLGPSRRPVVGDLYLLQTYFSCALHVCYVLGLFSGHRQACQYRNHLKEVTICVLMFIIRQLFRSCVLRNGGRPLNCYPGVCLHDTVYSDLQ